MTVFPELSIDVNIDAVKQEVAARQAAEQAAQVERDQAIVAETAARDAELRVQASELGSTSVKAMQMHLQQKVGLPSLMLVSITERHDQELQDYTQAA